MKKIVISLLLLTLVLCSLNFGITVAFAAGTAAAVSDDSSNEKVVSVSLLELFPNGYTANTPIKFMDGDKEVGTLIFDDNAAIESTGLGGSIKDLGITLKSNIFFLPNELYNVKEIIFASDRSSSLEYALGDLDPKYATYFVPTAEKIAQIGSSFAYNYGFALNSEHVATEEDPYSLFVQNKLYANVIFLVCEQTSYKETVAPTKAWGSSTLYAGDITVHFYNLGYQSSGAFNVQTSSTVTVYSAPGFIITSVTFTSPSEKDLLSTSSLTCDLPLQATRDGNGSLTLTGFEAGKDYEFSHRTSYLLKSVTVTYEKHVHTGEFTPNSDANTHWDECVCKAKINEEAHTWDSGVVTTEPTHLANGVKTFTCGTCSATKTEAIAPSLQDAKANITLAGTLGYNGSPLTQGVVVKYGDATLTEGTDYTVSGNVNTEMGNYHLTVTGAGLFTGEVELDYTIGKGTYDMNGVIFAEKTVTYNGSAFSIEATNLPTGVSVTYENNGKTNAGTYTIVAKFTGDADKYNAIPNMTATLTINKATVAKPAADATVFTYNGAAQTYTVAANAFYTVSGNTATLAGTHTVSVALNDKDNYQWADGTSTDLSYAFVIARATVAKPTADPTVFTYNGAAQTYTVAANAFYTVSGNTATLAGTHTVGVALNDKDNYQWADGTSTDLSYSFVIAKATYNMSGVVFADKTVTHNGSAFSIEATNLPTGVSVTYENNSKTDAGVYTVVAKFTGDANYNAIPDMAATLTVKKSAFSFQTQGGASNDFTVTTEAGVDPDANLIVELIEAAKSTEDFAKFLNKNQKVGIAYDVKLLKDGATVQPDGTLKFKVLIPAELRGKEFDIMHVHADTETAMLDYEIEGDFVVFESDKLSEFVFVYETGSLMWLVILLAVIAAELGILLSLLKKKARQQSVKLSAVYPPFVLGMFVPQWQIACIIGLLGAIAVLAGANVFYALKLSKATPIAIVACEEAEEALPEKEGDAQ